MLDEKDTGGAADTGEKSSPKLRADSNWSGLTVEQHQTLERWLFEENLSYRETLERARKELGVEASLASLQRFRRRVLKERTMKGLVEAYKLAEEVNDTNTNLEGLRSSGWKLVGKHFLEKTVEGCDLKELRMLGHMMAESEDREIRRERLALAWERFQFSAAKAVWKLRPLLEKMAEDQQKREDAEIDEVKPGIFGRNPYKKYEKPG